MSILDNIFFNFHWNFYTDQEQMIRVTLFETIKMVSLTYQCNLGLKLPIFLFCTQFCIAMNSFLNKRIKKLFMWREKFSAWKRKQSVWHFY